MPPSLGFDYSSFDQCHDDDNDNATAIVINSSINSSIAITRTINNNGRNDKKRPVCFTGWDMQQLEQSRYEPTVKKHRVEPPVEASMPSNNNDNKRYHNLAAGRNNNGKNDNIRIINSRRNKKSVRFFGLVEVQEHLSRRDMTEQERIDTYYRPHEIAAIRKGLATDAMAFVKFVVCNSGCPPPHICSRGIENIVEQVCVGRKGIQQYKDNSIAPICSVLHEQRKAGSSDETIAEAMKGFSRLATDKALLRARCDMRDATSS